MWSTMMHTSYDAFYTLLKEMVTMILAQRLTENADTDCQSPRANVWCGGDSI